MDDSVKKLLDASRLMLQSHLDIMNNHRGRSDKIGSHGNVEVLLEGTRCQSVDHQLCELL